jgi:hypothetical protein
METDEEEEERCQWERASKKGQARHGKAKPPVDGWMVDGGCGWTWMWIVVDTDSG